MGPKQFDVQIFDDKEDSDYFEDNAKDVLERMYDYVLKNIKWDFSQRERRTWVLKAAHRWSHKNRPKYTSKDIVLTKSPPENELRKERVLSEHELRVQRSLQKLDVPEWYKNHPVPAQGFLLKRHSDAGVPPAAPNHHWPGLSSKTTSLSSLGSAYSSSALRNSPDRTSNSVAPPCPPLFSRWSTSKLNSAATSSSSSPCGSARSSFNHRTPYLGWRYSQERLNKPKTPNERLAASILQNSFSPNCNPNDNEVRTSIKEVTSAIVHYVSAREQGSADKLNASSRYLHHDSSSPSRSVSPKGSTGKVEKVLAREFIHRLSSH
ncbi:hypothetical protein WDU94_009689 [Cyamophila willieti]